MNIWLGESCRGHHKGHVADIWPVYCKFLPQRALSSGLAACIVRPGKLKADNMPVLLRTAMAGLKRIESVQDQRFNEGLITLGKGNT
jgi:hypothetical protein